MAETKKYWKGIEEFTHADKVEKLRANEFPAEIATDEFLGNKEKLEESGTTRRDFLKYLGFSTAAATLAACETPVIKSIPYVIAPEEVVPGVPNYYATTYYDGHDYASILVKTREGRPIKIENNPDAPINGGANARVHASVLNLYDTARLKNPMINGQKVEWSKLDESLASDLAGLNGQAVVFLTSTVISPSMKKLMQEWGSKYPGFRHVQYDAFSWSGKLDAQQAATGKRAFPLYKFGEADVIVSFAADFLGDWIGQGVSADYARRRVPGKDMSRHLQFESNMTLTGASADKRHKLRPSEIGPALLALKAEMSGGDASAYLKNSILAGQVKAAAKELRAAGSKGLVVSGTNNADVETITIEINRMVGNSGSVIDYNTRSYLKQGNDREMQSLITAMKNGEVGAILMDNINPAYCLPAGSGFEAALKKVGVSVYFTEKADETAALSKYICAKHNYLESWGDAMPADGMYSLRQPAIRPLFDTRQTEECLLKWMGNADNYHTYFGNNWQSNILGGSSWSQVLQEGTFKAGALTTLLSGNAASGNAAATNAAAASATTGETPDMGTAQAESRLKTGAGNGMEIVFYQKTGIGVGNVPNNPWLMELPDPITRVTWDNYLTISAADASELELMVDPDSNGAINGSYVEVKVGDVVLEKVPVYIQPGQARGTVALAVGYGRNGLGKASDGVGVNAFALMQGEHSAPVSINKVAGVHPFASVQLAHTMMGRKIVNETSLDHFLNQPAEVWNKKIMFETHKGSLTASETNLWDDFDHEIGPMWNMSIDLNLCSGCGACVIACHAENNVPVVGKDEVRRHRDMHWLRIDRYYSSDMNEDVADEQEVGAMDMFAEMEKPGESPDVYFQPVMCQHCNHAPCETVCPVIATSHGSEGLNHMTYNRCIGTRYCANNCPYKVRRFNWFQYEGNDRFEMNYAMNNDLGKMVLNPDVTVRARGVMEKCSMCIQRIQLGKLSAKKKGRKLKDGEIKTACQEACDTGAIQFGNVNDRDSKVFALKNDKRMYHLLEEVGTQPSVFYQTKVRNRA